MILTKAKMSVFKLSSLKLNLIIIILATFMLNSCGIYKPVDARKVSANPKDRVEKNIQEGKGYRLFDKRNQGGGTFSFATSNPLWRASIELLDFTPLSNVDYSGGIIITDWFSDEKASENEQIKITVKFLSNEIRADGLDVIIHKKICNSENICNTIKIESAIENEIKLAILKKAAELEENAPLVNPNYKVKK
jgi:hypothetical protein